MRPSDRFGCTKLPRRKTDMDRGNSLNRLIDIIDICGWDQSGYIVISNTYVSIIEGSLEVKLPTIWTDGKAEVGRVREEKRRSEKIREEKE